MENDVILSDYFYESIVLQFIFGVNIRHIFIIKTNIFFIFLFVYIMIY